MAENLYDAPSAYDEDDTYDGEAIAPVTQGPVFGPGRRYDETDSEAEHRRERERVRRRKKREEELLLDSIGRLWL